MSDKTPCNKIDRPLVVYIFSNVTYDKNIIRIQKIPSGGPDVCFFNHRVFYRGLTDLPREAIGPKSVPVFLKKHIANCGFRGGIRTPCPLSPSGSAMLLNMEEIGDWSNFQGKPSVFCFNFIHLRDNYNCY